MTTIELVVAAILVVMFCVCLFTMALGVSDAGCQSVETS
jgi:hypothetical protein